MIVTCGSQEDVAAADGACKRVDGVLHNNCGKLQDTETGNVFSARDHRAYAFGVTPHRIVGVDDECLSGAGSEVFAVANRKGYPFSVKYVATRAW
jgi:hypothetical protein